MNGPSQEALERRLERLEQSLRHWRIGLLGGLLLLAVASFAALATRAFGRASPGPAEELVVRSLVLVDGEGERRATLGMGKAGPLLVLLDENEQPRAGLSVTKAGPVLALLDENGQPRAALTATKDGPGLALMDKRGKMLWRAP